MTGLLVFLAVWLCCTHNIVAAASSSSSPCTWTHRGRFLPPTETNDDAATSGRKHKDDDVHDPFVTLVFALRHRNAARMS
jgi:hypothetical protein